MPVILQCKKLALSLEEVERLWGETISYRQYVDDEVTVRCVSEVDSAALNLEYREKDAPTNVLTFSYDGEHDIALCLPVVLKEAQLRAVPVEEYTALVLVHSFLHATGMDHELSDEEAERTREAEKAILSNTGFETNSL